MGRRILSRRSDGRFRRATLENTFGLSTEVCPNPDCRRINPYAVGEAKPTHCHACGQSLAEPPRVYLCTFCKVNPVDAEGGFDTCDACLRKM